MKVCIFVALAVMFTADLAHTQTTLVRADPISIHQVPLAPNAGSPTRDADHATVAMNSNRDIAVAFHSSRANGLKQVEVAYYSWQSGDTWDFQGTQVVGSIGHDPIGLQVSSVKCERPDTVAADDKIFVVWTRRYQLASPIKEPAVLECAWLEWVGPNDVKVYNNGGPAGLGFKLDAHVPNPTGIPGLREFWVKDCAGVPDAVVLNDPGLQPGEHRVAVAYPHQTDGFQSGPTGIRKFEMRIITCTLNALNVPIKGPVGQPLQPTVLFNGATSGGSGSSAGLVLPDLAPSAEANSFWLAAEAQTVEGGFPHGRIRLEYWQENGGSWAIQASKTFKSPSGPNFKPYVRRRPNISSFPEVGQNQFVTIAFNKIDPNPPVGGDGSTNVVLDQVEYDGNGFVAPTVSLAIWPNSPLFSDGKPVPLRGKQGSSVPSCFADRSPGQQASCDIVTNNLTVFDTNSYSSVARPAVAYHYHSGAANPHYVAPIWEKKYLLETLQSFGLVSFSSDRLTSRCSGRAAERQSR